MQQFRPVAFRPLMRPVSRVYAVALGNPIAQTLGTKDLGQTFDSYLGMTPAMGDALRLVFHGIATYLGIWIGLNASKIKTGNKTQRAITVGLAWALAGGQGLGAIADIMSLVERAIGTHPPDQALSPVPSIAPVPPVK